MLNISKMPKQVVLIDEDLTFNVFVWEMPTICIFGALWCNDTERIMTEALPKMIDNFDWKVRFCFVVVERTVEGEVACRGIKKWYGIYRYPSIAGFAGGKMLESGLIVSEGPVEAQIRDLEMLSKLALGV
jgi:hypothetical protein